MWEDIYEDFSDLTKSGQLAILLLHSTAFFANSVKKSEDGSS